jgi:hypothetical protein
MTFGTPPSPALRAAIGERLLIADGAMGSMLQGCPVTLDDFAGHEGCNEILNVTRPDIVRSIHDGYLDAGVDCITTNTFGANLGNLGEYGIADRIEELAEAGARIARKCIDDRARGSDQGRYPAVSEGDDLVIFREDGAERERLKFPRQRHDRHLCLADFFRSRESGQTDVVGFQLVTVGSRISEATAELFAKNAYRDYLELHGLSVQLAEALAEYWHGRVRQELGIAGGDPPDLDGLFKVRYQGCRYAFGYPACPDLEDRAKVMRLLEPERIGVTLSEEFQLAPEQSTDALITHHPEASYFST